VSNVSHLTSHLDSKTIGEEVPGAQSPSAPSGTSPGASFLPMGTTTEPLVPAPLPAAGGKVNALIAVGISALAVYLILQRMGK
jgi:hypothetical protein